MTDTSALRAFIEARLAEDEATARAATDDGRDIGSWFVGERWNVYHSEVQEPDGSNELVVYGNRLPESEHIARHDPARVLREVAAKRARLELADKIGAERGHPFWAYAAEQLLKLEAAVWSDHADYRPEWSTT
jgi:hypothetical protein